MKFYTKTRAMGYINLIKKKNNQLAGLRRRNTRYKDGGGAGRVS